MEYVEELKPIGDLRNPVLLVGFRVQERAGRLASRCINHLVDQWRAEAVAQIDMTSFLDLVFNRPQIRRTETESSISWPAATLYLARTAAPDRDLLLFSALAGAMVRTMTAGEMEERLRRLEEGRRAS